MLNENIKNLRKEKGISQEELANKLNVVRQTVSKWEQGLSVPDSEMLIKISEIFEVPVSKLIGETFEEDKTKDELARISQRLENLNAMLAEENAKKKRRNIILLSALLLVAAVIILITSTISFIAGNSPLLMDIFMNVTDSASIAIIGGADGPTQVLVSSQFDFASFIMSIVVFTILIITAILLLRKTKK